MGAKLGQQKMLLKVSGAKRDFLTFQLADDQHEIGIDGALIPWRRELWDKLRETGLFENMKGEICSTDVLPPKYKLLFDIGYGSDDTPAEIQRLHEVTVVSNDRVTAEDHFQGLFESSRNVSLHYEPGDVLMVQPCNLSESIEIALDALKYPNTLLDRPFYLSPSDKFVKLPPKCLIGVRPTLRNCFKRLFDLQVIPRKSFFQMLASISTCVSEKEKLLEFVSPHALDDFLDYTTRCRRTTAEVLRDFPETSSNIPPERLFDLFTTIRARAFSICSAPSTKNIEILVAKVLVRIRNGTFKFPKEDKQVICVGPGTGVAPFRSYLLWRNRCENSASSILFFGCRGKKRDFYFEQEWDHLANTKTYTAFSRDTDRKARFLPASVSHIYVQHLILQHADEVWEILGKQDGSSGNMPKEVALAIDAVAVKHGCTEESFHTKLESCGRLQYETWS
ncbi:FAD binding domain protein [Necator americanus]|uniref:FAD binding domain protein n=1 Tax=Necator americanus TaxID=51031 RepID=W2SHY8_NECAM|nr:FAD binding domain protein [Necator americanus]ETN69188.1 FAD binding domain protein [Necator americanus]